MRKLEVAILGTGPSAAYAAQPCDACNVDSQIMSSTSPSTFYPGAFWPRSNPLEKDMPLYKIYISKVGTAEKYLEKQWGEVQPEWLEETSFPTEARYEFGLNPYELFSEIWKDKDIHLSHILRDEDVAHIAQQVDLVLMTFPTKRSKEIFGHELIKHPIVSYKTDSLLNHYCIYDGENDKIVRMSSLFGFIHNEYSKDYIPDIALIGAGQVTWMTDTLPDTPEWDLGDTPADNVYLIGRHAQWSRKKLAHHAFDDVIEILEKIL